MKELVTGEAVIVDLAGVRLLPVDALRERLASAKLSSPMVPAEAPE